MTDPVTLALVSSSIKLLESGLKLSVWDGWTTFPTQERLVWLTKLLGLGGDTIGKASDLFKHLAPASARPEQAVQLWAIHVACFGEALAVYWGGSGEMAGRPNKWGKWFAPLWVRERSREAEAAIKFALDLLGRTPASPLPRSTWLETPIASPMYQALWSAFVDPEITHGAVPLLPRERDGDRQVFERAFTRTFREALARSANIELRGMLSDCEPRGEALRQLLVADMAAWRYKHVFASVDTSEGIPDLPLEKTYVEPMAKVKLGNHIYTKPVLTLIEELLGQQRVVFVSADFGMGKSLTARTLAWRWSAAYLNAESSTSSAQHIFPIYVRCADVLSPQRGLNDVIRKALKCNAEAIGIFARIDDSAFNVPPPEQRTVVLLDGLDELALNTKQVSELLRELLEYATDTHRFVVFSRPEALPQLNLAHGVRGIPHVRIQRFDSAQIDEWLWGWPQEGPSRGTIEAQGLGQLARVPILLFMLVLTWRTYVTQTGKIPHAQIYEAFFNTLATGKYERSGDIHPQIRAAAEGARDILVSRGEISRWRGEHDGRRAAVEAIRWLMDRIAWEALRREFSGAVLSRRHVEMVLEDELGMPESTIEQVRIGLLLGMQAQLDGENQRFFFGHRSFLEFAVARYWERQLRRMCSARRNDYDALEETLGGAPLIEQRSRTFQFLHARLVAWEEQDRRRLLDWSRATVDDDTIRSNDGRPTFRKDRRMLVRQAALTIGCYLAQSFGEHFRVGDGSVLLLISTWWIAAKGKMPLIDAPAIHLDRQTHLARLVGPLANFKGAKLEEVNLAGSYLRGANFEGADLDSADLSGADLRDVNLRSATLELASLDGANLADANMRGVSADGADFTEANLIRASLVNAELSADFVDARLKGANLAGANLGRAFLMGSDLERANLAGASLAGANLERANLAGASLVGANLVGATLTESSLERSVFDPGTQWPEGFAPPASARMVGQDSDESYDEYAEYDGAEDREDPRSQHVSRRAVEIRLNAKEPLAEEVQPLALTEGMGGQEVSPTTTPTSENNHSES